MVSGRHGHDSRAVPGPQSRPMDASRHGPKKGGPIGPMGSTISPFKYYVIHYQTIFKHFRAAGLPGQTGRPGPIKSISGRAWAGTSAHGQARHGPLIFSCLSGSCLNGPCLDGPVPDRAGPPVWPPIGSGVRDGKGQTNSVIEIWVCGRVSESLGGKNHRQRRRTTVTPLACCRISWLTLGGGVSEP